MVDRTHRAHGNHPRIRIGAYVTGALAIIITVLLLIGGFGKNDTQNWQVRQSVFGNVDVKDSAGWYFRKFATVWTYPRAVQKEFKQAGKGEVGSRGDKLQDQSIRVTFNDAGWAMMGCSIRYGTPKLTDQRLTMHSEFGGNIDNVTASVKSHLVNCLKASGPLMSSTEHMSARKAEFTQLVHDQLANGLYRMRQIERTYRDETDSSGNEITVFATEIIKDQDGKPLRAQASPLLTYGLEILQFSIEDVDYDPKTKDKFAAKKDSLLRAEQAKADREQEVQQRLMIIERGLRERAEVEAIANKERAQAVINAEREKEVAELEAAKKVAVAEQTKLEAETKAAQLVAVAELKLKEEQLITQAIEERAQQIRVTAEAEEERIQKAGAITEQERVLAEIKADRDVRVASELAKIGVPSTLIVGGNGENGSGSDTMANLINMTLMRAAGVLPSDHAKLTFADEAKRQSENN